jgi:hypothetical protein
MVGPVLVHLRVRGELDDIKARRMYENGSSLRARSARQLPRSGDALVWAHLCMRVRVVSGLGAALCLSSCYLSTRT